MLWRFKDTLSEEAQDEGEAPTIAQLPPTSPTMTMGMDMTRGGRTRVEGDDIIDIEEDTQHGEETPTHVDGGLGGEQEVKEPDCDVKEPAPELRRSQRVVIPSSVLKSPWIEPKRKSKGKRTYDEKDTLFEMCTKSVPRDEAAKQWFSTLLDSLVEHVTYYRMQHEKENPTLKTTKKKKKTVLDKSKDLMANKVRNHFLDILRTLKPELLQDDHKIPKDVTWAKVHVQPDTSIISASFQASSYSDGNYIAPPPVHVVSVPSRTLDNKGCSTTLSAQHGDLPTGFSVETKV
ncbi:hypothetical protein K1719_011403 [Acacia pycnantha]|nr:hypothetical protein K1719_011403 [Acacia pycnantha]